MDIALRQLTVGDGPALARFYNGLSESAIRTFRPLGLVAAEEVCAAVCQANQDGDKYDLAAWDGEVMVGWGFIWGLKPSTDLAATDSAVGPAGAAGEADDATPVPAPIIPTFGLGVADSHRRMGLGSLLTDGVLAEARRLGLCAVDLTVVKDNAVARRLYESRGFSICGELWDEKDLLDYFRMRLELPQVSDAQNLGLS